MKFCLSALPRQFMQLHFLSFIKVQLMVEMLLAGDFLTSI